MKPHNVFYSFVGLDHAQNTINFSCLLQTEELTNHGNVLVTSFMCSDERKKGLSTVVRGAFQHDWSWRNICLFSVCFF